MKNFTTEPSPNKDVMVDNKKPESPDKKKTIMIVDDEEACREIVQFYFENDYNIIPMSNGQEAMEYLKNNDIPDLIILDMQMPNMNGRLFLHRIRKGDPKLRNIPIIFSSSVSSELFIKSVSSLAVTDYIVKPFKREEIDKKVNAILKQ